MAEDGLTLALGLLVEQAWLVVELFVDGLDLSRDRCVDVRSSLDLLQRRYERWYAKILWSVFVPIWTICQRVAL